MSGKGKRKGRGRGGIPINCFLIQMHCYLRGVRCCSCWDGVALHSRTGKNLLTFTEKDHMEENWMRADRIGFFLCQGVGELALTLSLSMAALTEV